VAFDTVRKLLNLKGPVFKENYLALLTPENRELVERAMSISWREVDINDQTDPLAILAKTIYPNDYLCLQKLGYDMAKDTMPRFYKIFIRIPSAKFIIDRVTKIWGSFYEKGEVGVENFNNQQYTMVLRKFPEYPAYLREYVVGYLKGVSELVNLKNVMVTKIETDPNAWKWEVHWTK